MNQISRRQFIAASVGAAAFARYALSQTSDELAMLSLSQASSLVRAKKVSPVELTEICLARITTYNPKINAFITVMKDQALEQARQLAQEAAAGRFRSPLHGIPIALKDNIDTAATRTTAASQVFEDRVPSEDAEVVRRLRAAGAVLIGKTNMHEFAAGGTSAVSYWGAVRNPWNLERNSGGSSGGSAAAVAMNCCYAALGTDTGGSIRTPSAYCGVVGFKPTYGRVSIRGIIPLTWSMDHCGPIARTVEDTALVLQQLAGYDRLDIDSVDHPVQNYMAGIGAPVAQFRLGIPAKFYDTLEDDVAKAIEEAAAVLHKMTAGSREMNLPSILGASANGETYAYHEEMITKNAGGYMPQTRRQIQNGSSVKASDYVRSWRQLMLVRRIVDDSFQEQNVDLLITPTRRVSARPIAVELQRLEKSPGPDPENTGSFDSYGLPAITVPCGFSKDGMPIGLQIVGPHWAEDRVLALAYAYQQATEWHKRQPPLRPDSKVPAIPETPGPE